MKIFLTGLLVLVAAVAVAWAQTQAPAPAPALNCTVELDKLRAYATILKADRDQKEAALADYGQQLRALTVELNALKAPKDAK